MAEMFLTGMGGSRGGGGATGGTPPPPERSQKGFLGNIGPDPLENRKATRSEFNDRPSLGRQRNAI